MLSVNVYEIAIADQMMASLSNISLVRNLINKKLNVTSKTPDRKAERLTRV